MILKLNKHFNGFFDKISSDQGLFRVRSRDQGKISSIKNLDPGRGWFYSPYDSDYPLYSDIMQCKDTSLDNTGKQHECFAVQLSST